MAEFIPHADEPKGSHESVSEELVRIRAENADLVRKWRSDQAIFRGALQLLKEAGLAPGSAELIAAADRFDAEHGIMHNIQR
jgi:hypothetical protein